MHTLLFKGENRTIINHKEAIVEKLQAHIISRGGLDPFCTITFTCKRLIYYAVQNEGFA